MNTRIPTFSLLAALCATQALAAKDESAQGLFDQHCLRCHETDALFTREDRKIGSFGQLENQVRRCEANLELRWFDEDISAVTHLLNDRFYHFKP